MARTRESQKYSSGGKAPREHLVAQVKQKVKPKHLMSKAERKQAIKDGILYLLSYILLSSYIVYRISYIG